MALDDISASVHGSDLAVKVVNDHWNVRDGVLEVEGHLLTDLVAEYGSPLYVYSAAQMRGRLQQLRTALGPRFDVFFSVKANPNPAVLSLFVNEGAGLEIASAAEYIRARKGGADPKRILFAGPGKTYEELDYVIENSIGEIHIESFEEIDRLAEITQKHGVTLDVSVRVNPAAEAQGGAMRMGGGPAAFGLDEAYLEDVVPRIQAIPTLNLHGLHLFAGTQILNAETLITQWTVGLRIAKRMIELGAELKTLDFGGGLGVPYVQSDKHLDLDQVAVGVVSLLEMIDQDPDLASLNLMVEPGRFLAGPGGLYAARVTSVKESYGEVFAITDGGMHHHLAASGNLGQVLKKDYPVILANRLTDSGDTPQKVVGPLCTPLDTYGRKTVLPRPEVGDVMAILQSGAYGLSASPVGFLSHAMPAEILVDGATVTLIRPKGTFENPLTQLP
ncbi:MAG: type III PLP-dependent enzyme [Pseudomonadota bacterium]